MKLMDFVKSLFPRIERRTITEDLRITQKELATAVIPSWRAAADFARMLKPVSDEAKHLSEVFQLSNDNHTLSKSGNLQNDIFKRLKLVETNANALAGYLDKELPDTLVSEAIGARQAVLVRAVANISFISSYSLSLLNYLYTVEAAGRDTEINESLLLSKSDMTYVERNFNNFVKLLNIYGIDDKKFTDFVIKVPDVLLTDRTSEVVSGVIGGGFDFAEKQGLAGFVGSPIYKVRLMVAQWQVSRYEAAKAKKQQLELRLLYLENQQKNKKDPLVEREISHLQDRIDKLSAKLSETEEELGV